MTLFSEPTKVLSEPITPLVFPKRLLPLPRTVLLEPVILLMSPPTALFIPYTMLLFVTGRAVEIGSLVIGLDCAFTELVVETGGRVLVRGLDCAWTEVVVGGVVVETLAVWSSLSVLMVPKRKAPRNRVLSLTIFLEDFVIIFDQFFFFY